MMLLDELIQMMIGLSEEQLARIKAFILGKLKLTSEMPETQILACPVCWTYTGRMRALLLVDFII